jgi:hypothetical protein
MKKSYWIFAAGLIALLLASCAAGPNSFTDVPNAEGDVAGFWMGLWQGFASPLMFVISLFSDRIDVYEVHNSGGWYNFGFLAGASIIFGGSGGSACKSRRRRTN